MTVTIRDNAYWGPQLAGADVIAGYLPDPGDLHQWGDAEWAAAQATGKVLWGIVFWGHDPADAWARAQSRGCRGVFYDVEGQFTQQAITSGQPQAFGDWFTQQGHPAAPYGTDALCDAVGHHYPNGATWRYRTAKPATVAPFTAYQWDHQSSYDESIADDWFARTGGLPVGGSFKPGTTEYHWCAVAADLSVDQYWIDVVKGGALGHLNHGGECVGQPDFTWSDDGHAVIMVLGLGNQYYRKVWNGSQWDTFQVVAGATGQWQRGEQGPPGTAPTSGTITGGTVTFP